MPENIKEKYSFKSIRKFTLLGGFILHAIVATLHTFSNITRYYHSYLSDSNPTPIKPDHVEILFSIVNVVNNIFIPVGLLLNQCFNTVTVTALGLVLNLLSSFILIYYPSISLVVLGLFLSAIGGGIAYMPIIIEIWHYFPERRGFATAVAFAGYGTTRLLFKYVSLYMVNPERVGLTADGIYPEEINERFKNYLKLSEIFFSILSALCVSCIYPYDIYVDKDKINNNIRNSFSSLKKKPKIKANIRSPKNVRLKYKLIGDYKIDANLSINKLINRSEQLVKELDEVKKSKSQSCDTAKAKKFFQLTLIFFLAMNIGAVDLRTLKKFGLLNGHSESFVSICSFSWKLLNVLSSLITGNMVDRYGFKKTYMFLLSLEIAISSSCYFLSKSKYGFYIFSAVSAFVHSSNLSVHPTAYASIFGLRDGGTLFSIGLILVNTFYYLRPFVSFIVTSKLDFLAFYLIITLICMIAMLILIFFDERPLDTEPTIADISSDEEELEDKEIESEEICISDNEQVDNNKVENKNGNEINNIDNQRII